MSEEHGAIWWSAGESGRLVLDYTYINSLIQTAIAEDVANGDVTTSLCVPDEAQAEAKMIAKQGGVVAGMDFVVHAFNSCPYEPSWIDCQTGMVDTVRDGTAVDAGQCIATIDGQARIILICERVALNFLQHMSGIATLTNTYVKLVSHTKAKIIDTRKTTPGLRRLEKYAVTVGGGHNHRFNLSDGILIKDNHIAAAGGVTKAVTAAKENAPHTLKIECEVTNLDELNEAIAAGADAVLLDNMPLDLLRQSVEFVAGRVVTEASGGVNEQTVAAIAETGVDLISVGALTHSAPALDISLNITQNA